ncbi:hypothetical protein NUM3379_31000 [Kineococcus sp. NUM-3379]
MPEDESLLYTIQTYSLILWPVATIVAAVVLAVVVPRRVRSAVRDGIVAGLRERRGEAVRAGAATEQAPGRPPGVYGGEPAGTAADPLAAALPEAQPPVPGEASWGRPRVAPPTRPATERTGPVLPRRRGPVVTADHGDAWRP